jgi:hypothetical protein
LSFTEAAQQEQMQKGVQESVSELLCSWLLFAAMLVPFFTSSIQVSLSLHG